MRNCRIALGICAGIVLVACQAEVVDSSAQQSDTAAGLPQTTATSVSEFDALIQALVQRENSIVECMAERGFEYVPQPIESAKELGRELDLYQEIGFDRTRAIETAREFGFGLFIDPEALEMARLDADEAFDANNEIRESLSEDEEAAYSKALAGDNIVGNDVKGCLEIAEEEVPDPEVDAGLDEAMVRMEEDLEQRLRADPRIVAAEQELDACFGQAGFDISNQTPRDYMKDRFRQLTGLDYEQVGFSGLNQVDEDTIDALRAEELQLAEVDATCHANYYAVRDQVGSELEQDVIEENPEIIALLSE